jgi:RNA polymerase sigma factor (sigma-70 family)
MHHESFEKPGIEKSILAPLPVSEVPAKKMRGPSGLPPYLAALYEVPLLTREQEYHLFRKFNYLKHKATMLREKLDPAHARTSVMDEIEQLYDQAVKVKNEIVQANLRLVVSIAKRHVSGSEDFFALVSDGNMSLIRAAEKFDFSRGNKFSTYASWAIMKNFARSIPDEKRNRERYMTGHEDVFEAKPDVRTDEQEVVAQAEMAREYVNELLEGLDPRTQDVIRMRNGLDGSEEMTLEQIGQHFGITKERVRQINVRGMKQLRERAQAEKVNLP